MFYNIGSGVLRHPYGHRRFRQAQEASDGRQDPEFTIEVS
jgi:hypothetical protein